MLSQIPWLLVPVHSNVYGLLSLVHLFSSERKLLTCKKSRRDYDKKERINKEVKECRGQEGQLKQVLLKNSSIYVAQAQNFSEENNFHKNSSRLISINNQDLYPQRTSFNYYI